MARQKKKPATPSGPTGAPPWMYPTVEYQLTQYLSGISNSLHGLQMALTEVHGELDQLHEKIRRMPKKVRDTQWADFVKSKR